MPETYYKDTIWTTHALSRLGQRGLTQDIAWQAFRYPDRTLSGKERGTTEFQKHIGQSVITIIAKQNEKSDWVIISCWVDPPLAGSDDAKKQARYREYKSASGWKKLLLIVKSQLGF